MVAVGDGATVRADSHVELLGVNDRLLLGPLGVDLGVGGDEVSCDDRALAVLVVGPSSKQVTITLYLRQCGDQAAVLLYGNHGVARASSIGAIDESAAVGVDLDVEELRFFNLLDPLSVNHGVGGDEVSCDDRALAVLVIGPAGEGVALASHSRQSVYQHAVLCCRYLDISGFALMVAVGDGATVRADSHVELLGVNDRLLLGPLGVDLGVGGDEVSCDDRALAVLVVGPSSKQVTITLYLRQSGDQAATVLHGHHVISSLSGVVSGSEGASVSVNHHVEDLDFILSLLLSGWGIAFSHCDCRSQGSQSRYSCNARNNLFAKRHLGKSFLSYVTNCPKAMPSKYRPECVEFPLIRIPKSMIAAP